MIRKILVRGMNNERSVTDIRRSLEILDGVMSVEVSLHGKYVVVDTIAKDDDLINSIEDSGYDVIEVI